MTEPVSNTDELKPCSLCGTDADVASTNGLVVCFSCGYAMMIGDWQTRPIEDALNDRIAELEAEVLRLHDIERRAIEQSEDVQTNWLSPYEAAGLKAENARLKEANRWIPISESLPDHNDYVLVLKLYEPKNKLYVSTDWYAGGVWQGSFEDKVIAWRPMPEPPEVE